MFTNRLRLGDKLELEIKDAAYKIEEPLVSKYDTQLSDGTLEILAPIYKGRVLYIAPDTKMDVIYQREGNLFKFKAIALESRFSGRVAMLRIKPVSEEIHIQRRNFYRINCVLDVEYRMFQEENTPEEKRGDFKKGLTKDISGGGICLRMNEKPERDWFLEGRLKLNQEPGEIAFMGKILRTVRTDSNAAYKYETSLEFIRISNKDREKIISFVFDYQRKFLEKGWYDK